MERANEWRASVGWLLGCNFIPSSAANQLEMWQAESFDASTIDRELGWAAKLGMNAVRVFLHDLAWHIDRDGFKKRFELFLTVAESHSIRVMPVLFDDCWQPDPKPGAQPDPRPGVHNSVWVQSPGIRAALDQSQMPRLEGYVRDVVATHAHDARILAWDLYNEVGNFFLPLLSLPSATRIPRLAAAALRHVLGPIPTLPLFRKTLHWARACEPSQPLTSAIWRFGSSSRNEIMESSDLLSFHDYSDARALERQIQRLNVEAKGRPIVCTEYLARGAGSTVESCLPLFAREGIGCFNWGLVSGKTQTIYPWTSRGGSAEPDPWHHDLLRSDGSAYRQVEADLLAAASRTYGGSA